MGELITFFMLCVVCGGFANAMVGDDFVDDFLSGVLVTATAFLLAFCIAGIVFGRAFNG